MTVTATSAKFPFTGNGATTVFPFTGRIFQASDIHVWASGAEIVVGFTVAFSTIPPYGGTVTFAVAPASPVPLLIERRTPRTQNTDWIENGGDSAASKEDAADRAMNVDQEQDDAISRAPKFPVTSTLAPVLDVPGAGDVGKFVTVKDVNGNQGYATPVPSGSLNNPVALSQGGTAQNFASNDALAKGLNLALWKQGADIVAAATIPLPNPLDGNLIKVTGNTGVTAIASAGINIGTRIRLWFTGIPVLTHGASLKLIGAASYNVQVNDILEFIYLGGAIWQEEDTRIAGTQGAFQAPALSRVWGLVGANNVGTPNSQFDIQAAGIVFFNPTDGSLVTKYNQGLLTNNVLTAGPAAGGRDQGAVFGVNVWVHFYFIVKRDGTVSTVSSISPPPGGPTLPTDYVAWAYAGAVRYNVTPVLVLTKFRGAHAFYAGVLIIVLNAGVATVATAVDVTAVVPPNALSQRVQVTVVCNFTGVIGQINSYWHSENTVDGAANLFMARVDATQAVLSVAMFGSGCFEIPGATLFYRNTTAGTTPAGSHGVYAYITGYKMPNGGE